MQVSRSQVLLQHLVCHPGQHLSLHTVLQAVRSSQRAVAGVVRLLVHPVCQTRQLLLHPASRPFQQRSFRLVAPAMQQQQSRRKILSRGKAQLVPPHLQLSSLLVLQQPPQQRLQNSRLGNQQPPQTPLQSRRSSILELLNKFNASGALNECHAFECELPSNQLGYLRDRGWSTGFMMLP